jgi:hypothetical protein
MTNISRVTDNFGKRRYIIPEDKKNTYPSVTTIIERYQPKTYLNLWKKKLGENIVKTLGIIAKDDEIERLGNQKADQIREEAAEFGSSQHLKIEEYLINKENPEVPRFHKLLKEIEPIEIEKAMFYKSDKGTFAGTPDLVGKINPKIFKESGINKDDILIFDWKNPLKTKYNVQKTKEGKVYCPFIGYYLQLSAYALSYNKDKEKKIEKALLCLAPRNAKSLYIYYLNEKELQWYSENFQILLYCYHMNYPFNWELLEKESLQRKMIGERYYIND